MVLEGSWISKALSLIIKENVHIKQNKMFSLEIIPPDYNARICAQKYISQRQDNKRVNVFFLIFFNKWLGHARDMSKITPGFSLIC